MKISVILPTFNRVELLARTLHSLRRQEFSGCWELVVSDDGSTDETSQLLEQASQDFPVPLRILRLANGGPARARNHAIAVCQSDWIAMTDDDCLPDSVWLARMAEAIDDHPQAVGIEGSIFCPDRDPLQHWVENLTGSQYWTANMAFRKDVLNQVGGFDEGFPFPCNEDVDLAVRVKRHGSIVFAPQALVVHPPRAQSLRQAARKFVNALESDWVFYDRNPEGYVAFKPLRHPRTTVLFLFFLQPLSVARHRWRYFLPRPLLLLRYLLLLGLERWEAVKGWRRWLR